MKKDIRKISLAFTFLTILCTGATGQTTPKEITDKFFALYATDPIKAVEYGFSTNKWSARKPDAITDLENKLKDLVSLLGDYYGYEELTEKSAGETTRWLRFYFGMIGSLFASPSYFISQKTAGGSIPFPLMKI